MKTALMILYSASDNGTCGYIDNIRAIYHDGGIDVSVIEVLSPTDDLTFKRQLEEFKDTADQLIIIGGDVAKFNLKEIIAKSFDTAFIENENAKSFFDAVSKANGKIYPEEYVLLPMSASVIPNILGGFQGFMLDEKELSLAVLPASFDQVKLMSEQYVVPYLENRSGVKKDRLTLKYFGDEKALNACIEKAKEEVKTTCEVAITAINGDYTIKLSFDHKD
jgi:molybdopterin-biosynthesis enzyme MoeA-like protein